MDNETIRLSYDGSLWSPFVFQEIRRAVHRATFVLIVDGPSVAALLD